jgi:hypothetical protein
VYTSLPHKDYGIKALNFGKSKPKTSVITSISDSAKGTVIPNGKKNIKQQTTTQL